MNGDIPPHLFGGRSRIGADGDFRESLAQEAETAVFGAEIMPPHADTVGLVDGDGGHPQAPEKIDEPGGDQPLGRHVEKAEPPRAQLPGHPAPLTRGQGTVEPSGGDAAPDQGVDLVLHQGNQGGNHQGQPGKEQGGRLVTEALPPAGREHHDRVPPPKDALHRLALQRTEPVIPPVPLQCLRNPICHGFSGPHLQR